MATESKSPILSVRLPPDLMARVDYVARNTEGDARTRSTAVRAALEGWLPGEERKLEALGLSPKKTR